MHRRKFIINGTIASTGLATSGSILASIGSPFNSEKVLNIGVVGTGDRGSGLIPFLNEIKNFNVYACCDVLPFNLENGLKRANGKAKGFSDYKDLLKDKAIDAIIVTTAFGTHSQIEIDATDAGKHVYCEKTLAKSYSGIIDLVAKVKQSNNIFQTRHQYQSSRLYTHVVQLIKDGKVGNISAFEFQWNRHSTWRRPIPDTSLEKAIKWRMYRKNSGGLLAELCSHQIDFVNTVLGTNPLLVMGTGGVYYWKDGREIFDNIHLIYNSPNGIKAKFTSILCNAKEGYQIKVIGDKGTMLIMTDSAKFYPKASKNKKAPKTNQDVGGVSGATWIQDEVDYYEPVTIEHENPSKQALLDFRDSILENKPPISDIITGAKVAICVQMGLDAMYNNKNCKEGI